MQSNIKQWIVVGGTGMTGFRVLETICATANPTSLIATSRKVEKESPAGPLASSTFPLVQKFAQEIKWFALDLEAEPSVVKEQLRAIESKLQKLPTALVFAAAYTNVDGCENDPALCKRINETNTAAVLDWAHDKDFKIAFYSTDYVFDGTEGPYVETHPRKSLCVYGDSKVFIEEWFEKQRGAHLVLRTTGVYDYIPGSKNFLMQVLENLSQKKIMRIPTDQLANPIWAVELAKATVELLLKNSSGIFHVAGGEVLPRTEFAKKIARFFGLPEEHLQPVLTAEFNQKAKRPLKSGLTTTKLKSELGWAPAKPEACFEKIQKTYGVKYDSNC